MLGVRAGSRVAAVEGVAASTSEDRLKAIGAAAASSGAVALFHAIGVTPEAPTWEAVAGEEAEEQAVTGADLRAALDRLSPVPVGAEIGAVSVGTPTRRLELGRLADLVRGPAARPALREHRARPARRRRPLADELADLGVTVVTDTCTYLTPVLPDGGGPVMTDSGKWAWYAPTNLGVQVALGSLGDCVRSAAAARVVRDASRWGAA